MTTFLQVCSVMLCDNFNTSSEYVMLGHETAEKIVFLLFV